MRIKDVNLGGGLFRLEVEPTHCCENVHNVPTHVMDGIMRDVAHRLENKQSNCCSNRQERPWLEAPRFNEVNKDFTRPLPFEGAEDGIDIHVDKPRREMYGNGAWDEQMFHNDTAAYNELKKAAKRCDWPCREPMKCAPQVPQAPQRCECEWEDDFEEDEVTLRDLFGRTFWMFLI